MVLNFDWGLFQQAQEAKNRNRQQMNQDIAGLGQGLGNSLAGVAQIIQEQKKKQMVQQLVQAIQTQGAPQQGPQLPGQGQPGMPSPVSGMGGPVQDNTAQMRGLLMQLDPQGMVGQMIQEQDPLRKMQAEWYKSRAASLGSGGSAKTTWYESPEGAISRNPVEGSFPVQLSDAQGAQYTAIPKSAKEKNAAVSSRAEAWQRSIDIHQIDMIAKTVGLTPKQQSSLQMNNQRAARANEILSKPNITWQELALGEIDLTGIMQGGVPQRDEIAATHFPGWQQNWAKWRTYATGHPTENVPPDIKKKVQDLINGVIQIDNRFLGANATFAKKFLGPTVRGGLSPSQKGTIDEMTEALTSAGQNKSSQYPSDKEARYQEYLRKRNASVK